MFSPGEFPLLWNKPEFGQTSGLEQDQTAVFQWGGMNPGHIWHRTAAKEPRSAAGSLRILGSKCHKCIVKSSHLRRFRLVLSGSFYCGKSMKWVHQVAVTKEGKEEKQVMTSLVASWLACSRGVFIRTGPHFYMNRRTKYGTEYFSWWKGCCFTPDWLWQSVLLNITVHRRSPQDVELILCYNLHQWEAFCCSVHPSSSSHFPSLASCL